MLSEGKKEEKIKKPKGRMRRRRKITGTGNIYFPLEREQSDFLHETVKSSSFTRRRMGGRETEREN